MVRINEKSIDDFLARAQETLQNSLIETGHSFTYNTGTLNYVLPGFALLNERIFSIDSIEGTGFLPEDYLTEDNLTEGIEYSLFDNYVSPEIVPDGYGTASLQQVFTGITITDQTFKDGSTVHLKYKYQNTNYVPILTNFSPNSVLRMILTATLLNMQETNSELIQSIESFGLNATGDDLDRIATLVGLERTEAEFASGQVKLINTSLTADYTVNTSHRFAAVAGGSFIAFSPLTGISVPKNDPTGVFIDVIAVESGSFFNVGSNSISTGFTNVGLTDRTPVTLTISNPPLGDIGQQNLFDNGVDEEIDKNFRNRVSLAFSQSKTSSYSTIEQAVIDTNLVDHVVVYDIDTKKDALENQIKTYVATETGVRLAGSTLSQISDAIALVKPVGSRPALRQIINTYINFSLTIYVNRDSLGNTTTLETTLTDLLDSFINSKEIGIDILPSAVVSLIKGVGEVLDVEIIDHTVTEYTSEAPTYDGQVNIGVASVATNWVALQVPLNSATKFINDTHANLSGSITLDGTNSEPFPVDDRTSPRVNIGVLGYDGEVRASPLDRTDYYTSNTRNSIIYDPATSGGDGITDPNTVLFNYNYFDNTLIDGLRIRLGGTSGAIVDVDFGYGSDPDDVNFFSFVTDEAVLDAMTITLDGTEKLYDVPFMLSAVPVQLDLDNFTDGTPPDDWSPDSTNFWIILKYVSGVTSFLPVDTSEFPMAFSPSLQEDSDNDGIVFETSSQKRANWHSYTIFTLADAYKKIVIPSQTDEPEKPIAFTHTFNFSLFVEE